MSLSLNVLIVEDEAPAAEKLQRYLNRYSAEIRVVRVCESVSIAVTWLREHQKEIDLIFMDIQLTDGVSFDIFNQVQVEKPVIFITAYNEYALEAFKVNSIAYLLKPVTFEDLKASLDKLERFRSQFQLSSTQGEQV